MDNNSVRNIDLVTGKKLRNAECGEQSSARKKKALIAAIIESYKQRVERELRTQAEQFCRTQPDAPSFSSETDTATPSGYPIPAAIKQLIARIDTKMHAIDQTQRMLTDEHTALCAAINELKRSMYTLAAENSELRQALEAERSRKEHAEKRLADITRELQTYRVRQDIEELDEYISALEKGKEILARSLVHKEQNGIRTSQSISPTHAERERIHVVIKDINELVGAFTAKRNYLLQQTGKPVERKESTASFIAELEEEKKHLLDLLSAQYTESTGAV